MASLRFTTTDPHDAVTRVLAIFRLLQVPLGAIEAGPAEAGYAVTMGVPNDPGCAAVLTARLSRLVCLEAVSIEPAPHQAALLHLGRRAAAE